MNLFLVPIYWCQFLLITAIYQSFSYKSGKHYKFLMSTFVLLSVHFALSLFLKIDKILLNVSLQLIFLQEVLTFSQVFIFHQKVFIITYLLNAFSVQILVKIWFLFIVIFLILLKVEKHVHSTFFDQIYVFIADWRCWV